MIPPVYTQANVATALQNLSPPGRAWPRGPDYLLTALHFAIAGTYSRLLAKDNTLIAEAKPGTAIALLPEWEETLGLPDPCAGPAPNLAARQAQANARFSNAAGQSIDFFVGYALALGYVITIDYGGEPLRFGTGRFGDRFAALGSAFTWTVNTPGPGPIAVLECEFARLKPAHTIVLFNYT